MSWPERISFLALGLLLTGWLYWLTHLALRTLQHAENALHYADRILWVLQQRVGGQGLLGWIQEELLTPVLADDVYPQLAALDDGPDPRLARFTFSPAGRANRVPEPEDAE